MNPNSDTLTIQDFTCCCRLCFERSAELENVFTSPNLPEKITDCLGVSILPDEFPATSICVRCLSLLEQFYDFKQLCKKHDDTFQTSIQTRNCKDFFQESNEIHIKSELIDEYEESMEQLESLHPTFHESTLQEDSAPSNEAAVAELDSLDAPESFDDKRVKRRNKFSPPQSISVLLIYNGYVMKCHAIKLNGTMQWICRKSSCRLTINSTIDWQITFHSQKEHNHYPCVDKKGMIRCVNSGFEEQYAVSSITGEKLFIWNGYEWQIEDKKRNDVLKAICKKRRSKCKAYLIITGEFESLQHFGEHNHQKNFIVYRDDGSPTEQGVNPWDFFVQINPCKLPIGNDWESNQRVKLFHNRHQYRLVDCYWSGISRWLCDTINCSVIATINSAGEVLVIEHNHEHIASGLLNGLYYSVVKANMRTLKLFFNGFCYGSRDNSNWVCTKTACHAKIFVGHNYDTFAEKGIHIHDSYNAVIKPLHKEAIHLTPLTPRLPQSITIEDLHEPSLTNPLTAGSSNEISENTTYGTELATETDDSEPSNRNIRMIYGGYRYTLWEMYPDGTTYWRCWGMRCNKSLHMTPTGTIYFRNESLSHQHEPQVTSVGTIAYENGQLERYAVYEDTRSNTILTYRNSLWHLLLGEASYIANCRESGCEAKIKITENFSRFEHIGECNTHSEKIVLIRISAEIVEGDLNLWELYKNKFPLRLVDGSVYNGGRNSQMFVGGHRYTLQGLQWNGSSLWRCAIQKCPARSRMLESTGEFQKLPQSHHHEKQELLQGTMWSQVRQKEENYFVIMTLKKTIATLYYNTYCYALKDKVRNVWTCFHNQCNASLRIEGDFERVVDELVHVHPGTLTFIRDEATAYQECYAPAPGTTGKRSHDEDDSFLIDVKPFKVPNITNEQPSASNISPKLDTILNALVKLVPKSEPNSVLQSKNYHYGSYSYNLSSEEPDGVTKLTCSKIRCPGRISLASDGAVLSQMNHTHSKTYDTVGSITDVNGQNLSFILVSESRRRYVTYFICDGFRYHVQNSPYVRTKVIWQCFKCQAKATVNGAYTHIELSSAHDHEPSEVIMQSGESSNSYSESDNTSPYEEIFWGQHRYCNSIYIRRMKQTKWKCYRLRECKAHVYRNMDGCFKLVDQHNHEGPIDSCREATFDQSMKMKDRFAILKQYGKSKLKHIAFQNQIYQESTSDYWPCVNKSCKAKLQAFLNCNHFNLIGKHSHQPTLMVIKFEDEV